MMRNPLEYYQERIKKIEEAAHKSTNTEEVEKPLSEAEIEEQNNFVIDFIVNQ